MLEGQAEEDPNFRLEKPDMRRVLCLTRQDVRKKRNAKKRPRGLSPAVRVS